MGGYLITRKEYIMKLVGIEHRKGFSNRTQKDYDFYVLHCEFCRPLVEGVVTRQVNCSPAQFATADLSVGCEIIVDSASGEIIKF